VSPKSDLPDGERENLPDGLFCRSHGARPCAPQLQWGQCGLVRRESHLISPEVDQDRFYLMQDLILSGAVTHFGFVRGVGVVVDAKSPGKSDRRALCDRWRTTGAG
jgi:hypothetical protein